MCVKMRLGNVGTVPFFLLQAYGIARHRLVRQGPLLRQLLGERRDARFLVAALGLIRRQVAEYLCFRAHQHQADLLQQLD